MNFFTEYWDWWYGGLLLAIPPILFDCEKFGISGYLEKILRRSETIDIGESTAFSKSAELVEASLKGNALDPKLIEQTVIAGKRNWFGACALIGGLTLGGLIDAIIGGQFEISNQIAPIHTTLFDDVFVRTITLFIGGLFVGWGTRLSGGCSSGHGMSGISKLNPNSFIATGIFMIAAILTTLLMRYTLLGA